MINRRIQQFQSGSYSLTGQWDEPVDRTGWTRLPAVIFCHGFTGNRFESRRMYARLSRELAMTNVLTFRFDHRGCGESEGDFGDFDDVGLLEDLDSALAIFLDNPAVDPDKTVVVGYSLGGLSASYLLGKRPEFQTGVLWAPVARPDIIRDRLATYPDFDSYKAKGFFDYMGFRVGASYIDNIGKLNPLEWVGSYKNPVLIIQGSDDPIVKPEQADLYVNERSNERDRLIMVPKGDHFFGSADNIDRVLQLSTSWIIDHIGQ